MKSIPFTIACHLLVAPKLWAAVTISSFNTPYTENFDSLISTGSAAFIDNVTLAGWTVNSEEMDTNSDEYFANTGSSNIGEVFSYGSDSSTDRALGYLGSSGNDYFNAAVTLTNNTGITINEIQLGYVGEQWRSGGNTSDNNNTLTFSYLTGTQISIPSNTTTEGWNLFGDLNFSAPQKNLTVGAMDGNLSNNRTEFNGYSISSLNWRNGEDLVLRWTGNDGSGSDAGIAIDDFSVLAVAAIPEPSAVFLISLTAMGWITRRR